MKPKITISYDFLKELGGLERVMFFQANKLSGKYDVDLLFSYISDKDKERITRELELDRSIKISQLGSSGSELLSLALAFLFPSRINKIKTDMLFSHSFMCTRMAYAKSKSDKTPYAVMIHHPPNFLYTASKGWVNNLSRLAGYLLGLLFGGILRKADINAVRHANLVIANSNYTARRIKAIYGIEPVVVYPIISSYFKIVKESEKKKFLNAKNISRPFLYAHGRLIPDKNYKILIPMLKDIEDYDLILSGSIDNKYKKELEDEIAKHNLQKRVRILGRISQEDLLGYYNCASLFLMPAPKEDFGMTVVEAMACGSPVIAWDDGAGPSETVTKENGLLALPYKSHDFVQKIKQALSRRWNKDKVARSVSRFSEKVIEKQLLHEISNVLR